MSDTLTINPEIVCDIAQKARQFHAKEDVVFPQTAGSDSDDWAMQVLADHADDLTYREVQSAINALEPDQQAELVALMWLGREDYTQDEWAEAVNEANERATDRTAEYLLTTPLLADYLEQGLAELGYSPGDVRE
jgi:hypothetical protein